MREIQRPLSLTPTHGTIFGNDKSKQMVEESYNEAFRCYVELIDDGWQEENAKRSADMTLVATLEAKLHHAVGGQDDE
jgi:hypothetical protein